VPCVTVRDETEWTELVRLGWNRLVTPLSAENLVMKVQQALKAKGKKAKPYGDGKASDKIASILKV
jgi:UDP-GlcNAc3NAcA epimerase